MTKEKLFDVGNIQAIQSMITQDEARQKEIKDAELAYTNQLKQYGLLASLGIMFLIGFILYRKNRQNKRQMLF